MVLIPEMDPFAFNREQVTDWLKENIPTPRVQHIFRVETLAVQLAERHQLDRGQAAQAGLMHDLAKYFPPEQLLAIARGAEVEITPVDVADPHLLHAEVSAIVAREQFQVTNHEVLAAIRNHTLGEPGMSLLSCVVFLADSLEPGRGHSPELETLRQIAAQDLYRAVWLTCDRTLQQVIEKRRLLHPRMVLTRNWALEMVQARQRQASEA